LRLQFIWVALFAAKAHNGTSQTTEQLRVLVLRTIRMIPPHGVAPSASE